MYTPEKSSIVHPLGDKPTLILDIPAEVVECLLLHRGEVAQPAGEGFVIRVGDAFWHRARAHRGGV